MACEQVLYDGYEFDYKVLKESNEENIAKCSQNCCDATDCIGFTFDSSNNNCKIYDYPDALIIAPFPTTSIMKYTGNPNQISSLFMKRKIRTWISWITLILVLIAIFIRFVDQK